jgi:rod shape-determining protein MreD
MRTLQLGPQAAYFHPMRWITFFALLYIAAALQSAHLGQLNVTGYFHLEFVPMLAIFYSLYAERDSAMLAALLCGLVYDLNSPSLLGLEMVLLGLLAIGITNVRAHVFRNNFISQIVIAFLAITLFLFGRMIISDLLLWMAGKHALVPVNLAFTMIIFSSALYSAVVAPLLFRGLFLLGPLLGFDSHAGRAGRLARK